MKIALFLRIGFAFSFAVATSVFGQINDSCANAIALQSGVAVGVNTSAASSVGDPAPNCVSGFGRGVWYTFTPSTNEIVSISTCGSDYDTGLGIYTGTCSSLSQLTCDDDNGPSCSGINASVLFSGVANTTYYILAGGYGGAGGNLQIVATTTPPPANDSCAGAVPMTNGVTYTQNTFNATEIGDPSPCCFGLGRGVWYTFTPAINERINVSTCGSDFNTALAVYTGTCSSLSQFTTDDDGGPSCSGNNASVNFSGVAGTTYYFLVGGNSGAYGNLQIVTTATPPPSNDSCTGAILMTNGVTYTQNTLSATEDGDPSPCCFGLGRGVWYTFTPPINERINVSTCGSDFNTALAVYTGTCSSLSQLTTDDDGGPSCPGNNASVNFSGVAGTTYYFLVGGNSGAAGNLQIITTATPPSGNDICTGAIPMTNGVIYTQNTLNATEVGDPSPCCFGLGRGVWYTFTPLINERINVSTCGSDFNTALAVYTGTCSSLSQLTSDDDGGPSCPGNNASVNFSGVAGTTYYFLVGGNSGAGGNLQIVTTVTPPSDNDVCTGAIPMTNGVIYTQNTLNATEVGDPSPCCFGLGRGVWYTFTPPINERINVSTCGSDFNTALAVYTGSCSSLSQLTSDDDGGPSCPGNNASVNFSGVAGTTYYFLVGGNSGAGGNLQIVTTATPPSGNDICTGAVPMTNGVIYTQNTLNATEVGDPSPCCFGLGRGVWYTFTPPINERINVSTCGSDFNTALAVYTGTCSSLSQLTSDDDGGPSCPGNNASVNFSGVAGTTYYFLVGGNSGAGGNLQIVTTATPPPDNDACTGAIPMSSGATYTLNTLNATEVGDPSPCCFGLGRGVWYTYTQSSNGPISISTCGSDFNTALAIYTGTCGSLSQLTTDDDSGPSCPGKNASVNFVGTSNTIYWILAGGNSGAGGNLEIQINVTPPANDLCSGATPITAGTTYSVATFNATSTGDPIAACDSSLGRGVWFSYTPSLTGPVGVTTCGSDYDTALAVYGGSCESLTPLACSHGPGSLCADRAGLIFNGNAGTTYYILAGGHNGTVGNLHILIPVIDLVSTNLTATNLSGGLVTAGRNFSAGWTVQNQGVSSLNATWTDSLSLSNASTNVVLLNSTVSHNAPAGGSYAENVTGTMPQIPAGIYSLIAQADAANGVAEQNKTNNTQVISLTVTNLPPLITLLIPTNQIVQESCVAVPFALSAQTQPGSYTITNVIFLDNATNQIGQATNPPYSTTSLALDHGLHTITAQVFDNFGLQTTSTQLTTITVRYPTNLNVMRIDIATNGDVVGCMCAYSGSNYVVETTTNLQLHPPWPAYVTNQAVSNVMAFTNFPADPRRFFRGRLLLP